MIYINDLLLVLQQEVTPVLYADDTSILVTTQKDGNLEAAIKDNLERMEVWFMANRLK